MFFPLTYKPKQFRLYHMTKAEIQEFTSWLGKRSYEARLARFGIERLREIARENGKKGGRPKGSGKKQKAAKAAHKKRTVNNGKEASKESARNL